MRDLLAHADLSGYAGQFVWLELSYDEPRNREFLAKYGATATPTFFLINPRDEAVVTSQPGVMSLVELRGFLERATSSVSGKEQTPADVALMGGDSIMAQQPEVNPATIKLTDPLIRQALNGVNKDGKPTGMDQTDFLNRVRSDPRWSATTGAQSDVMNVGLKVLKSMGLR